jgi:hypothetical protein
MNLTVGNCRLDLSDCSEHGNKPWRSLKSWELLLASQEEICCMDLNVALSKLNSHTESAKELSILKNR